MNQRSLTLGGDWTGVYDYEGLPAEAVAFTATLTDVGGVVWGSTSEPNTFSALSSKHLFATISGMRSGRELRFRKEYEGVPEGDLPIAYSGLIRADGNRIEGRWRIGAGASSVHGPFVMNRLPGAAAKTARHLYAETEI